MEPSIDPHLKLGSGMSWTFEDGLAEITLCSGVDESAVVQLTDSERKFDDVLSTEGEADELRLDAGKFDCVI